MYFLLSTEEKASNQTGNNTSPPHRNIYVNDCGVEFETCRFFGRSGQKKTAGRPYHFMLFLTVLVVFTRILTFISKTNDHVVTVKNISKIAQPRRQTRPVSNTTVLYCVVWTVSVLFQILVSKSRLGRIVRGQSLRYILSIHLRKIRPGGTVFGNTRAGRGRPVE